MEPPTLPVTAGNDVRVETGRYGGWFVACGDVLVFGCPRAPAAISAYVVCVYHDLQYDAAASHPYETTGRTQVIPWASKHAGDSAAVIS